MKVRVKVLLLPVEEELRDGLELDMGEGDTLGDLVMELSHRYPLFRQWLTGGGGGLLPHIRLVVGGVVTGDMETSLSPGTEIALYPAIAGG